MKYQLLDLKTEYLSIQKEIDNKLKEVILNSRFILDKDVEEFENKFAKFTNTNYCIGVGSGTAALFISLHALGITIGDEVLTTPHTFAATAEAIRHTGAKPVFIDIDEKTHNINASKIEEKITSKTKAILAVHLYGHPCNLERIEELCLKYNLFLIEDCAQAHGALYKNKHVGSFGVAGCFSFYPGKNLGAYGDAGAIVTNNEEFYKKVKILRNHGRVLKYEHEIIGYCERLDNLQAAILTIKLKKLKNWNKKRSEVARLYNYYLDKNIVKTPFIEEQSKSSYYVYTIKVDKKIRDELIQELTLEDITTGIYYPIPLHLQNAFSDLKYKKNDFPVSESTAESILSLPMNPFLKEEDVSYISRRVNTIIKKLLIKL